MGLQVSGLCCDTEDAGSGVGKRWAREPDHGQRTGSATDLVLLLPQIVMLLRVLLNALHVIQLFLPVSSGGHTQRQPSPFHRRPHGGRAPSVRASGSRCRTRARQERGESRFDS